MSPALNWSPASPFVNGYAGAATMNPAAAHFVVMLANDSGLAVRPWLNRTTGKRPDAAAAFAFGDPPAVPVAGYHTSVRSGRLPRVRFSCLLPTANDAVGAWPETPADGRAVVVRGAGGWAVVGGAALVESGTPSFCADEGSPVPDAGGAAGALGPQPANDRASRATAGAHRRVRMSPNLPHTLPSTSQPKSTLIWYASTAPWAADRHTDGLRLPVDGRADSCLSSANVNAGLRERQRRAPRTSTQGSAKVDAGLRE